MIVQRAQLRVGALEDNVEGSGRPGTLRGFFTDANNLWPITTDYASSTDTSDVFVQLQTELAPNGARIPPGYYFYPQEIVVGSSDTTTYIGHIATFIQDLYFGGYDSEDTPYERRGELILFPPTDVDFPQSSPSHVLTNHFKVHKDSIRLGIYYTVPNINQ